jgi:hypothetical protein
MEIFSKICHHSLERLLVQYKRPSNLYEEVMKIEGFEEFDNLNGNEVLARLFEK